MGLLPTPHFTLQPIQIHVLWLNPEDPNSFPPGLLDALLEHGFVPSASEHRDKSLQTRLRRQMQADALQQLHDDDNLAGQKVASGVEIFPSEFIGEAIQFLSLTVIFLINDVLTLTHI